MLDYEQINIVDVLEHYSIQRIREFGEEINFSCPFPKHVRGDRNPSAYLNKENGMFHCFSCGKKGNLATFVADLENVSLAVATRWLRESYGGGFTDDPLTPLLEEAMKEKPIKQERILPEEILHLFQIDWPAAYKAGIDIARYLVDTRGLTTKTLLTYKIGYDPKTKRVTFPVHNEAHKLVGIKGRATRPEQSPKYLSIGDRGEGNYYGFPTCSTNEYVWGISTADEPKIVVEGEIDAMKLRQYGYTGTVALGGSNPSESQIKSLKRKSQDVILMLDPDTAGRKAEKILADSLGGFFKVLIARLPSRDPAESTQYEIEQAITNTIYTLNIKEY